VLFSEPKIPQYAGRWLRSGSATGFSALQRAENSSIAAQLPVRIIPTMFQCSSASRKFLNQRRHLVSRCALGFQCSSASRKFLNRGRRSKALRKYWFQCSSASRKFLNWAADVSDYAIVPFQCSSASRKFLNENTADRNACVQRFQCSSASRKFLNSPSALDRRELVCCFSALQRAENSSITFARKPLLAPKRVFQCSSASRKFLNPARARGVGGNAEVSVLFSEPKIPQ